LASIYEGLVGMGILSTSLASGVGLILAGVLAVAWGWINWSNSGCGVIVHFYVSSTGDVGGVYVESQ